MKKLLFIIIPTLLLAGIIFYWFFLRQTPTPLVVSAPTTETSGSRVFNPLNRNSTPPQQKNTNTAPASVAETPTAPLNQKLPVLRHLSTTPIGGYMASSTTATSTVVRYIDRGVGHVYESLSTSQDINKISNTTIPKVYESYWNKNLSNAVLRYMKDETGVITNFFADIRPVHANASSSLSDNIPYEIKGKFLSPSIKEIAVSPKGDKIFTFNVENGRGVGYVSGFDESKKTKVLDTPLTQVNVDWPEENTIAISTKASGVSSGYLYLLDIKKSLFKRVMGGVVGLNAKVSADAKKIVFSSTTGRGFATNVYNTSDGSVQTIVFNTTVDKCVWSKKYTSEIYCAVPTEIPAGIYPDDWYKGSVSFVDQIWHLDTTTGEVHLIANLLNLANDLIDATNLTLDPKENFLYFVNKKDLTLWSLDITE